MRTSTMILALAMILTGGLAPAAFGEDPQPTPGRSLGNQLTQNQTHWYQKAALKVGPASDVTIKKGTRLDLQAGSYLYLEGDSTLHQYQMNANTLQGSAEITGTDPQAALEKGKVGAMGLVVPVADLKSRESGLDDNAHRALGADKNPEIKFVLTKASLKDKVLTARGDLTIAGTTIPITLSPEVTVKDGVVELKGDQPLKMSDYKVTPPSISLVVTSIKCTNDIAIHYDVKFAVGK